MVNWKNSTRCEKITGKVDKPRHRQRIQLIVRLYFRSLLCYKDEMSIKFVVYFSVYPLFHIFFAYTRICELFTAILVHWSSE